MMNTKLSSRWLLEMSDEDSGSPLSVAGWVSELDQDFGVDLQAQEGARPTHVLTSPSRGSDRAQTAGVASTTPPKAVPAIPVFGIFLNQSRRDKGWTVQQLAGKLEITAESVVRLESGQSPQPMLVSKIAKLFSVPAKTLLQIAGHAKTNETIASASLAFAAKSNAKPLDAEQRAALKDFVRILISK